MIAIETISRVTPFRVELSKPIALTKEKSFRKKRAGLEVGELAWVSRALWRAFPDAKSENELCQLAATALATPQNSVSSRTVRNWLRAENAPHFRHIRGILVLAGAEAVFRLIDAGE